MSEYKLLNVDAMEALADVEDESVDLIILDPDYQKWNEYTERGIIPMAVRVLKPTGNLLCFTKQPFDNELRQEIDYMFRREIIWTFTNGGAWVSNKMPLVSFQKVYWCTPSKDFYFNPRTGNAYAESTKDFKRGKKVFGGYEEEGRKFQKSNEGVWLRDHLHYNKPNSGAIPAKPLELVETLVKCFCPDGGMVLDPFAGSGNIGIACSRNNRNYMGFEINEERAKNAVARIEESSKQDEELSLF